MAVKDAKESGARDFSGALDWSTAAGSDTHASGPFISENQNFTPAQGSYFLVVRDFSSLSFFVEAPPAATLWKTGSISVPQNAHPYSSLDTNGSLVRLEKEMKALEDQLGKIDPKDLKQMKEITARLEFLKRADAILKSTPEISPLLLSETVEKILSENSTQNKEAEAVLQALQKFRTAQENAQFLLLRVAQEYPSASPLIGEVDFSRRNPRVLPYHSNGYLTPEQVAAVYQPPIERLQALPVARAYEDLQRVDPQSADKVSTALLRLREYETLPFSLGSVEAIEKETARLGEIADPEIPKFLARVAEKREKLAQEDPQTKAAQDFQGGMARLSPHLMILSLLESAPEGLQVNQAQLDAYRDYFVGLRDGLKRDYDKLVPPGMIIIPDGTWERSPAKKIQDRLGQVEQAIATMDSLTDATPQVALVRYAKIRFEFELKSEEPALRETVRKKLEQVEQIPSGVKNEELVAIRSQLSKANSLSPQERIQFYARASGQLDELVFPRSLDAKIVMLKEGKETVGITDRTINWALNFAPRTIGRSEEFIELGGQTGHLEVVITRYQEVQDLYDAGKVDEARRAFLSLEQSTLMATAADKVQFSASFNRYAVGLGLVAAAAAVGYSGGTLAEPLFGKELSLLLVNAPLFWATYEYLDAKTKGVETNPFYHPEEDMGQNTFRVTKGILYTYGALKFIGMANQRYWEGARATLFAQAEKEMLAEGALSGAVVKGSVEEGLVFARVAMMQSRFFTGLRLHAGAYAHEVLALGGWEFTQANIEFALNAKFDPVTAAAHTVFSWDAWKHRAIFVAGLKVEGKVSQSLGYRQVAELIRDKTYQAKFNYLENQVRTAEVRLQEYRRLAETNPDQLPPSEKMLQFLGSYRKGLERQLEMARRLPAQGIELDGLQYLSARAAELTQVKALEAFTQARVNYFKEHGIEPLGNNFYRYSTARGIELVRQFHEEGAKIQIAENGIVTIEQKDQTLRLIPNKPLSTAALAQMRKVLSPSEQQNTPLSNLVDGAISLFENPAVVRGSLVSTLPFLASCLGPNSPINNLPDWAKYSLGGIAALILGGAAVAAWGLTRPDGKPEEAICREDRRIDEKGKARETPLTRTPEPQIVRDSWSLEAITKIKEFLKTEEGQRELTEYLTRGDLNGWLERRFPTLNGELRGLLLEVVRVCDQGEQTRKPDKKFNVIEDFINIAVELEKITDLTIERKTEALRLAIGTGENQVADRVNEAAWLLRNFRETDFDADQKMKLFSLVINKFTRVSPENRGLAGSVIYQLVNYLKEELSREERYQFTILLIDKCPDIDSIVDSFAMTAVLTVDMGINNTPIPNSAQGLLTELGRQIEFYLLNKAVHKPDKVAREIREYLSNKSLKPFVLYQVLFPDQPFSRLVQIAQNLTFTAHDTVEVMMGVAIQLYRATGDFELQSRTHGRFSRENIKFYEASLREYKATHSPPDARIVGIYERLIGLYKEVYREEGEVFGIDKYKEVLSPKVMSALRVPSSDRPTFEEIKSLALSIREVTIRQQVELSARDKILLADLTVSIQKLAFAKCDTSPQERGTRAQAQKMATLVYSLYGSGYGNKGWLQVAQNLERISQNWQSGSERELRIYGALAREMVLQIQESYHDHFDPLLRRYEGDLDNRANREARYQSAKSPADFVKDDREERALFTSITYRRMAVSQLANHVQELAVADGNREAAQSVLNLLVRQVNTIDSSPLAPQFYHAVTAFPQDPILVGGKGLGLAWLAEWAPGKVPQGFVLSPRPAGYRLTPNDRQNIRNGIEELEKKTGRRLGAGLAVSVRSGAAISMPGAMQTQLNVRSIEDVYRYVEDVYASWDSPSAKEYRLANGIPDQWGTAVSVVQMMDGTKDANSGSGVAHSSSEGAQPVAIAYSAQHAGEVIVGGQSSATSKLPEPLARELAADMKEFEKRFGEKTGAGHSVPIEVEFTVESGKLHYLQIRRALLTDEQKIEWYAQRSREGTVSKAQARQALGGNHRLEQMKQTTVIAPSQDNPILYQGPTGIGKPVTGQIAFNTEQVAAIFARGAKAVLVTDNPDARESTAGAIQAGGVLLVTQTPASEVAHLLGVARTQGLSLMQISSGQATLTFEGGTLILRIGAHVYRQGDPITLEPNSPMTIEGPACRPGPRSRLYAGAMQMAQGQNSHLPAIEYLLAP